MSGNTQISLSNFDDCNTQTTSNSIAQKCCEFGSLTLDFDFETEANSEDFNIPYLGFVRYPLNTITPNKISLQSIHNFYTNLPPPSGYELIKVVQVYRI